MPRHTDEVAERVALARRESSTTLDLSALDLDVVPDSVGTLANLTTLDLHDNGLTRLPVWLNALTKLSSLDVSGNKLRSLPSWLGGLTNLTSLSVSGNALISLPETLGSLAHLTSLHLGGNRLGSLPDWLGKLTTVTELYLSGNKLSSLPNWLGRLTNLTSLSVSGNALISLPETLGGLANLTSLHLSMNKMDSLPDWLGNLTNLTSLHLSYNQLVSLPEVLGNLTGLTELYLAGNKLSSLPDWLGGLTNLARLHLGGNELGSLPETLGGLTNLATLHLNDNELRFLPEVLGELIKLAELDLRGNPLASPPPEVVAGGTQAVLAFLRAGRDGGSVRLWRSKLVLVGQGRAGKTSLVNALSGRRFVPGQQSTVGLELSELSLPADRLNVSELTLTPPKQVSDTAPAGERMRLSVWDFGGQEIYHATHQFFLTARSLFLVVWDPNIGYEYSRLPYWLNTVTARAPDAPILLVATHGDQRPADLPLEELRRRYPAIVGAFTVDSATGHGVNTLRAAVAQHAAALPLMGASWPKTWAAGADALRNQPGAYISLTDARTVLAEHFVADDDHAELLSALTFLGDVLHYPHERSLANTVVLDPQWLNTHIARILDSKQVAARGGTLLKEDVHREWADLDPVLHEHFLTMMDLYDISYRVPGRDTATAALVTALLPWKRPDLSAHWPEHYNGRHIELTYQLSHIPPGIPTWFITRTHPYTVEHWRTGALLHDPATATLALVETDLERGTLHLAARGDRLGVFLRELLAALDHTLNRYPGLSAKRLLNCLCTNTAPGCPHRFNYTHLLTALIHHDTTTRCPESYRLIDVAPLLDGIAPTPADLERIGGPAQRDEILRILRDQSTELAKIRNNTEILRTTTAELAGTRCPSVFTVRAVRSGPIRTHYQLRVCCQYPDGWHEIKPGQPGAENAVYELHTLHEWARKIAPTAQTIAATAKNAAPLIGLLLGAIAPDLTGVAHKAALAAHAHLGNLPGRLPLLDEPTGAQTIKEIATPTAFAHTDADYRQLNDLLTALDANRENKPSLGGLSATQDATGQTIYLCPEHAPIL